MSDSTIQIRVNGEERRVAASLTVSGLLALLELPRTGVAVERNRAIVPRAEHEATALEDGDVLEIVTLVGGG